MGLPVENLKEGMYLICLKGPMVKAPIGHMGIETQTVEERSLNGLLLRVVGISPPYVAVDCYPIGGRAFLDTRLYELGAASESYVKALAPVERQVRPEPPAPLPIIRYVAPEEEKES